MKNFVFNFIFKDLYIFLYNSCEFIVQVNVAKGLSFVPNLVSEISRLQARIAIANFNYFMQVTSRIHFGIKIPYTKQYEASTNSTSIGDSYDSFSSVN